MSLNIDYVQDENDNVNIKYYTIDPSSYIGKLAFPISLSSRLSTSCLEQIKSYSDNKRNFNNQALCLGDDTRNSNSKICEDAPISQEFVDTDTSQEKKGGDQNFRTSKHVHTKSKSPAIEDLEDEKITDSPACAEEILIVEQQVNEEVNVSLSKESGVKDTIQEKNGGDYDMLNPKLDHTISKSPTIDDLEDKKITDSPVRAEEILIVEQQVNEEVDLNQNFPRTEEKEVEELENDHKGEDSPRDSYINDQELSTANSYDKPLLQEYSERKQVQTPTSMIESKVDSQSLDSQTPGPNKKASSRKKYSEEFRIKVVLYAKTHTQRATSRKFGIPRATVGYWCSLYSFVTDIAIEVLDEIIEAAVESKFDVRPNSSNYSLEFRRTVLAYAKAHTPTQAAKKYSVSKSSIRRWKEKQGGKSSDVKPRKASGSESFEDLYSDDDSLGAKKRRRRRMSTEDSSNEDSLGSKKRKKMRMSTDETSDDSDDANSLGVCKRRNEREPTPKSVNGNKLPRTPRDPHQLRLAVLDYARKHSFEEASEVFKVDVETISGWLY